MANMKPTDVPRDLAAVVAAKLRDCRNLGYSEEMIGRRVLAAVLPLHEQQVRERIGVDFKTEWGVRRHGVMKRLFPGLAVDWAASEAEARHEAANPSKPGTVVTRLVGGWRDVDV